MYCDVLFGSAAAVLFSLQIHVLHLPFSYSIPELIIRSYRTFDNSDANDSKDNDSSIGAQNHCPALWESENGYIEGECQNAKPQDSCIFQCGKGYSLHGQKVLLCSSNSMWDGEQPKCVKVEKCEPPAIPDNGSFKCIDDGSQCELRCHDGFTIDGKENKIYCISGKWSPFPKCIKSKTCSLPDIPNKGQYTCSNDVSMCFLKCNEGFTVKEKVPITHCTDGEWSPILTCIIGVCPNIMVPENGTLDGSCVKAIPGQICKFDCKEGYVLDGPDHVHCNHNFQWSETAPKCSKKETDVCPKIQTPAHAVLNGSCVNPKKGEICFFKCNDGYMLHGKEQLICRADLDWSGRTPFCRKKEFCPDLQTPKNAIVDGPCKKAKPGDGCSYKCKEGYVLHGEDYLYCLASFNWSHAEPRCDGDEPKDDYFDCSDIKRNHPRTADGIQRIYLHRLKKSLNVFCDMTTDGGGWTVFQRRTQAPYKEDFFRNWLDYKTGFGNLTEEFWLGNENIHALTSFKPQMLRIDMEDFENRKRFARYLQFNVSNESNDYKLTAREYKGDAGDSLNYHNGKRFTTMDHGVDSMTAAAKKFSGAWWYINSTRTDSNLNGLYLRGKSDTLWDGVIWYEWHGSSYSLQMTEMKMRPRVYSRHV